MAILRRAPQHSRAEMHAPPSMPSSSPGRRDFHSGQSSFLLLNDTTESALHGPSRAPASGVINTDMLPEPHHSPGTEAVTNDVAMLPRRTHHVASDSITEIPISSLPTAPAAAAGAYRSIQSQACAIPSRTAALREEQHLSRSVEAEVEFMRRLVGAHFYTLCV